jgi:hypothetical protein
MIATFPYLTLSSAEHPHNVVDFDHDDIVAIVLWFEDQHFLEASPRSRNVRAAAEPIRSRPIARLPGTLVPARRKSVHRNLGRLAAPARALLSARQGHFNVAPQWLVSVLL